jgi:hypothetical protein
MKIRHYGLFANRCKGENILRCRELLGLSRELPEVVNQSVQEMMIKLTGKDITLCPCCGKGTMCSVCLIPEGSGLSGYESMRVINFENLHILMQNHIFTIPIDNGR